MITVTSLAFSFSCLQSPCGRKWTFPLSTKTTTTIKQSFFNNKINTIEKDNSASKGGRKLNKDTGILGANSDILIGTVWVFKEVLIQALGDP